VAPYQGDGGELSAGLAEFRRKVHQTIKKVTDDIEDRFHFNTATAAVMELVNAFYQAVDSLPREQATFKVFREAVEAVLLLMSPMVPHVAEELWEALGHQESLQQVPWPQAQEAALAAAAFTVVVQVNGKVRSKIRASASATEEELKDLALADATIQEKWLKGQAPRKVVLAPNRKLVNIVI
jgi:leucyl-tRNA synthetase